MSAMSYRKTHLCNLDSAWRTIWIW